MNFSDIPQPDTLAAQAAREVAAAYYSPSLLNHCLRSYAWGAAYATQNETSFDAELLYVSSMLHDIGLVTEFDNVSIPFEDAGGQVAWVFAAGAGWPVKRRVRAAEVIERHMWADVDPDRDQEGHLLAIATGLDISGRHADWWDPALLHEVVEQFPRLDLRAEFIRCFENQAARKPHSSAARAVQGGFAERMAANILERGDDDDS